jgi:hypothetical protein
MLVAFHQRFTADTIPQLLSGFEIYKKDFANRNIAGDNIRVIASSTKEFI